MEDNTLSHKIKLTRENMFSEITGFVLAHLSFLSCLILNDGKLKKALLKEYQQKSDTYEKAAKKILSPGFPVPDIVALPYNQRTDALRICSVIYHALSERKDIEDFLQITERKAAYSQFVRIVCDSPDMSLKEKTLKNGDDFIPDIVMLCILNECNNKELSKEQMDSRIYVAEFILNDCRDEYDTVQTSPHDNSSEEVRYFLSHSYLPLEEKNLLNLFEAAIDCFDSCCPTPAADEQGAEWMPADDIYTFMSSVCLNAGISMQPMLSDFVVTKQRLFDAAKFALDSMSVYHSDSDEMHGSAYECMKNHDDWTHYASALFQLAFDKNLLLGLFAAALSNRHVAEVKRQISTDLFQTAKSTVTPDNSTSKLRGKLDVLQKQVKKAEQDKKNIETVLFSTKNRESALKGKLAEANRKIEDYALLVSQLEEQLNSAKHAEAISTSDSETIEHAEDIDSNDSLPHFSPSLEADYSEELDKILSQYKVCIVGGNENLIKKFRTKHPNGIYIGKEKEATCDQTIRGCDAVLFKYDACSHSLYDKCKSIAQRSNVPFGYVEDIASVSRLERCIYKTLEQLLEFKGTTKGSEDTSKECNSFGGKAIVLNAAEEKVKTY